MYVCDEVGQLSLTLKHETHVNNIQKIHFLSQKQNKAND
jgi:hypothetical protein